SRSADGMVPAIRSPRSQPRITSALSGTFRHAARKPRLRFRIAVGFAPKPRPPGTEIFAAETGAQNPARLSAETDTETTRSGQKPAFSRTNARAPNQVRGLE